MWRQTFSEYSMLFILLLLGGVFSVLTLADQHPTGAAAARQLADSLAARPPAKQRVLIVVRNHPDDAAFADALAGILQVRGQEKPEIVSGGPSNALAAFERIVRRNESLDVIACTNVTAAWGSVERIAEKFPSLAQVQVITPHSYKWPNFLKVENLMNVANQIAVIAILAIGMTLVIIAGQIDLSVGSLIALSAVVAARLIRDVAGAEQASAWGQVAACTGGIAICGGVGAVSGVLATLPRMPSFIVTLAMMLIGRGIAEMVAQEQSINQVPETFTWLGRKADLLGVPNSVVLMLVLYGLAHVLMTRTVYGRYLYAVGGNAEAARLSSVPVRSVTIATFVICGALAGLGGVVLASQLKSGAPTYGQSYELYVIAAVVVGGTSLSGGEGKVFGTLIGAFIIAVIHNGMNLLGIVSHTQKVVLGLVILVAVLLDRTRRRTS